MYCIETQNLSYTFSENEKVLKGINMQVPTGSIYGFLGPNGAGKTTTLRLILGLLKKQHGDIILFNKPFLQNRVEILKHIGSLIESPSVYAHLTATENLKILQKIYRCPSKRIEEVLEIVGLSTTGNKKAGQFSLGMKQRLSIAIALLPSPALLILDEPTNGLDPNGIIETRELLKRLNREEKMTLVISSHLLTEIEKLVTHIGIINKGHLLFQGTINELHEKQRTDSSTFFETGNTEKTLDIILANGIRATIINDQINIPTVDRTIISKLIEQLVNQQVKVYQVNTVKNNLESIFIDLTKN